MQHGANQDFKTFLKICVTITEILKCVYGIVFMLHSVYAKSVGINLLTTHKAAYTPCQEKGATLLLPVTPRNANRFSKFFYRHALQ